MQEGASWLCSSSSRRHVPCTMCTCRCVFTRWRCACTVNSNEVQQSGPGGATVHWLTPTAAAAAPAPPRPGRRRRRRCVRAPAARRGPGTRGAAAAAPTAGRRAAARPRLVCRRLCPAPPRAAAAAGASRRRRGWRAAPPTACRDPRARQRMRTGWLGRCKTAQHSVLQTRVQGTCVSVDARGWTLGTPPPPTHPHQAGRQAGRAGSASSTPGSPRRALRRRHLPLHPFPHDGARVQRQVPRLPQAGGDGLAQQQAGQALALATWRGGRQRGVWVGNGGEGGGGGAAGQGSREGGDVQYGDTRCCLRSSLSQAGNPGIGARTCRPPGRATAGAR